MRASPRRNRSRRVAIAVIAVPGVLGAGIAIASRSAAPAASADAIRAVTPRGLPGGGTSILPEHRVLAHYGAPQARELGILGIGTPAAAALRLARHVRTYAALSARPIMPAMELIAVIVSAGPGRDGRYRYRQTRTTIRRYLAAARAANAILILDIQPGRSDFMTEARALAEFLVEPDVGLALDPEWRMGPGQLPGRVIGSVDAAEINAVTAWLSGLVARRGLPDKLVIVHQFTGGMIRRRSGLRVRPGVDMVLNADGFGTPSAKIATYGRVTRGRGKGVFTGLKLFFEEDTHLMSPARVVGLRPSPAVVIYE